MMDWFRRTAGVIAGLVVAAMGAIGYISGSPFFGNAFLIVGLVLAAWQGWQLYATRPDPYDLKRLWDTPPEISDPDPSDELLTDEAGAIYCHHCGNAVAGPFTRCPNCGGKLR